MPGGDVGGHGGDAGQDGGKSPSRRSGQEYAARALTEDTRELVLKFASLAAEAEQGLYSDFFETMSGALAAYGAKKDWIVKRYDLRQLMLDFMCEAAVLRDWRAEFANVKRAWGLQTGIQFEKKVSEAAERAAKVEYDPAAIRVKFAKSISRSSDVKRVLKEMLEFSQGQTNYCKAWVEILEEETKKMAEIKAAEEREVARKAEQVAERKRKQKETDKQMLLSNAPQTSFRKTALPTATTFPTEVSRKVYDTTCQAFSDMALSDTANSATLRRSIDSQLSSGPVTRSSGVREPTTSTGDSKEGERRKKKGKKFADLFGSSTF